MWTWETIRKWETDPAMVEKLNNPHFADAWRHEVHHLTSDPQYDFECSGCEKGRNDI